ncbi:hypothetical protein CTO_0972 [Chlamydia trachomatis A2497]|uniref:Uncharacterized protein n=1 Tax=Chlamydia trachomatis serovar A (strain A2497) TaxID=580047 RepID=G4NMW9_CHLT4|nr:hypothetical protein CTO_0972 [Chlamydia trachomatis A2497]
MFSLFLLLTHEQQIIHTGKRKEIERFFNEKNALFS